MIIVTGAYGFIGSRIVRALNEMGETDLLLVDDMTNGVKYVNLLGAEFDDYLDVDDFLSRFSRWNMVWAVYHQGAISSTVETDGKLVMSRNYQFSKDLFTKCIQHQIPVTYASSASVYGNDPDGKLDPLNLYAYSKMLVDQMVEANMRKFKLIHGWRYFNVYGAGEAHKGGQASPVTQFTQQAKTTGVIKLFEGSDRIYRDFIAVDDVVRAVMDHMRRSAPSGIRDLGTGVPMSFETVAHLIKRKHGGEIEIIPFPEHLKGRYQFRTQARMERPIKCMSMADWLDENP